MRFADNDDPMITRQTDPTPADHFMVESNGTEAVRITIFGNGQSPDKLFP